MIEPIFPTLLYINVAEGKQLVDVQSEIALAIQNINLDYNSEWGKTHKISSLSNNIIDQYNLNEFKKFLQQNLDQYLNDIQYYGKKEYKLDCWVSRFDTDDYGHTHNHGNADISGVYYFQTTQTDGDLVFYNPAPQVEMSTCFRSKTWRHQPMIGKILLFPGYLSHGIYRNQTDQTRISISFNVFFNKH